MAPFCRRLAVILPAWKRQGSPIHVIFSSLVLINYLSTLHHW
jgi:hypothetical protein